MGSTCSASGCSNEANTQRIDCGDYICSKHCFGGYCQSCYRKHGDEMRNSSEVCNISW